MTVIGIRDMKRLNKKMIETENSPISDIDKRLVEDIKRNFPDKMKIPQEFVDELKEIFRDNRIEYKGVFWFDKEKEVDALVEKYNHSPQTKTYGMQKLMDIDCVYSKGNDFVDTNNNKGEKCQK